MSESTYRTLVAWQRAVDLVVSAYAFTASFPADERYSLTQQVKRAALSVPSLIAEGKGRATRKDFRHFCVEARGSLYELETLAESARRLQYVSEKQVSTLVEEISRTVRPLNGLIDKLTD
jgi:four helix bundle protein